MAATPLTPTLRYYVTGTRRTYWLPACANYLAPTRAELNAGTDLTAEINAMTGWSIASAMVDTPDMGSRFTTQIPGALTSASNDITFYTSSNSNDVRSLLLRDLSGFIVLLWEGDVAGLKMDVFPVRITTQAMDTTITNPGMVTVSFAASRVPATNLIIPA